MTIPAFNAPAFNSSAANVRQLKILVLVLVGSNLGLGFLSVWLLRDLDRSYNELLDTTVPALTDMQRLTVGVINTQRTLGTTGLLNSKPASRKQALERARGAFKAQHELVQRVLALPAIASQEDIRAGLMTAADAYESAASQFIALMEAERVAEAGQLREAVLLGAFDQYVTTIERTTDALKSIGMEASDRMSDRTRNMSTLVLGAAGWPVIVVVLLSIFTAVLVIALVLIFRGREMGDAS